MLFIFFFFFFNDTATTEIYTLSLHDALPIWSRRSTAASGRSSSSCRPARSTGKGTGSRRTAGTCGPTRRTPSCSTGRSEEHTSELQSRQYLVCRLLLEKKKKKKSIVPQQTVR